MLGLIELATGSGKSDAFTEAVARLKTETGRQEDPPEIPSNVRAPHFSSTRGRPIPPPGKHAPAPTKPKSSSKAGGGRK